jgi:hypothetical protein
MSQSHPHSEAVMLIPAFWSRFLMIVAIGKGAIVGAGLVLAGLGALDIALALTAQEMLKTIKPVYLDYATAGGGLVGAVWSWISNR